MIRVSDLDKGRLTAEQVHDSIQLPEGAILREGGRVVARREPADEVDLEDEWWAHDPEQVIRGVAARHRFKQGQFLAHEDVKQRLGRESDK